MHEVGWCAEVRQYRDTWRWRVIHRGLDGLELEVETGILSTQEDARREALQRRDNWLGKPRPLMPSARSWVPA